MIRQNSILIGFWSSKKNISIFDGLAWSQKRQNCVDIYEFALHLWYCGNEILRTVNEIVTTGKQHIKKRKIILFTFFVWFKKIAIMSQNVHKIV